MPGTEHRPDPGGEQSFDASASTHAQPSDDLAEKVSEQTTPASPVPPSAPAAGGGRHRSKRGFPTWVLPTAGALALGLLVGVSAADSPGEPAAPSLPSRPAAQPVPHTVAALTHVQPVQVDIPAIGVSSHLVDLGLNGDRTLEVPVDYAKAGWYARGTYPGDPQGPPAIIVGHVDDFTGPAVFARLGELTAGAEIVVIRADNTAAVFRVLDAQRFPKDEFPAEQLYAPVAESELVLITCTGPFDEAARSYLDNLVVRARLDLERSKVVTAERAAAGLAAPDADLPNV